MENKVLAVVDGREIRESDLHALLHNLGQNAARFSGEDGRKQLIDELVMQELLYSDALENGLDQDEEYLKAVEEMTKSLLKQFALNKLLRDVSITEEDALAYFNEHKDLFKKQPSANASHILVATEEEALSVLKEIKEGLSFEEAADKYSSCPSKAQGGALGQFSRGQMVPEFEEVVFTMNVDEISEPVQTQFGYHIIKLHGKEEAEDATFEEVKDKVHQQCMAIKHNEAYVNKQAQLKEKYTIEIQG